MNNLKYSLYILIGACSYGILASIVKLGLGAGFAVHELTSSQYLFGLTLLILVLPFVKKVKISFKKIGALMLTGTALSLTGILYGLSLERNPASIAVVLLFQFTWIGILLESVYLKKMPSKMKVISALFLIIGTVFASNIVSGGIHSIALDGLIYGVLSAVTFALFIFFSGKVATDIPTIQRSVFISLGGLCILILIFGSRVADTGIDFGGIWPYGLMMAFFGVILPIVLFALGTPHIDSGLATIVGSAELPAAVLAAMLILGEQISQAQIIGIVIILIGICLPQFQLYKSQQNRYST
ncbi:EamA family transporter [Cytobacillus purgationiresistens]|uniref:Drug/metabolite transporter (DMT)-like permease n=1 Tax=Cytobacillus purgationiresistens TaxID=863449 RepID=A0ABU0AGW6_9BACI|nr:DMT family transporter [Cytobacillus purgationiresistens]MDQ0270505.1 drug/metabolite transporter (DMT)-like permease [Cytobacillus purgationiresistens]